MSDSSPLELALSAGGRDILVALRVADRISMLERPGRGAVVVELIDEICRDSEVRPDQIERIRVEVGPGSFTGIRTAVVTARTASELGGAGLTVFTRFDLLAVAALRLGMIDDHEPVTFALDARRGRVHRGVERLVDGVVTAQEPPRALRIEDFEPATTGSVFVDESLDAGMLGVDENRVRGMPSPRAADLFDPRLGVERRVSSEVLPLYLMGSYIDP